AAVQLTQPGATAIIFARRYHHMGSRLGEGNMRSIVSAGAVFVGAASIASAEEVTLRAVSAFAEKTTYSQGFERFIERVNRQGKGVVQINYIGGPKAMPPLGGGKGP